MFGTGCWVSGSAVEAVPIWPESPLREWAETPGAGAHGLTDARAWAPTDATLHVSPQKHTLSRPKPTQGGSLNKRSKGLFAARDGLGLAPHTSRSPLELTFSLFNLATAPSDSNLADATSSCRAFIMIFLPASQKRSLMQAQAKSGDHANRRGEFETDSTNR